MTFRIRGLPRDRFAHLFGLDASALAEAGAERHIITSSESAPCRVTLDDAAPGEAVLLLSYEHQPAGTPYRQAGPIFLREAPGAAFDAKGCVPPALARRMLSVRCYDGAGAMIEADLVQGEDLPALIARFWANPDVSYAHAHYARRGCFAAEILR